MSRIDSDTRRALAAALRLTPSMGTCHLFSWPGLTVTPGTYDRVRGRWVLRADGGSVPIQHRAMSGGRLGTPDRNHDCHYCAGTGSIHTFGLDRCPRCTGTGELRADRSPLGSPPGEFRRVVDATLREYVSAARAAGKLAAQLKPATSADWDRFRAGKIR